MRYLKIDCGLTGRGMIERVWQQWMHGMHSCAEIHDAMTSQTRKHHITSQQTACGVRRGKAASESDSINCDETGTVDSEIQGSLTVYMLGMQP